MANLSDLLASKKVTEIKKDVVAPLPTTEQRPNRKRPWLQQSENLNKPSSIENRTTQTPIDTKYNLGSRGMQNHVEETKTDNKPETKWQQTDNKPSTKPETKWQQTDSGKIPRSAYQTETDNKPSTQPATQVATKWQQTDNKPTTKAHFSALVGLQREIIILFYNQCKISRSKSTGPLTLNFIASFINTTGNSAKVTIQRLEKKLLLKRIESKNGRGGWARFELSELLYRELLLLETDNKLETKWQQTDNKPSTKPSTQPATSSPIVVVSSNFKNTTNTETPNPDEPCFVIPNELTGKVSRRQLSEFVASGKITEYDLQLSLDAFAFDLRNKFVSIKHSSNPVGLLIGAIKNNGSYNSAKYIEALKSELKPLIDTQREFTAEKASIKTSPEWAQFLEFKQNNPDAHKKLEEKIASIGLKGALLEDFTFLEYKKEVLKIGDEAIDSPLRPFESQIS